MPLRVPKFFAIVLWLLYALSVASHTAQHAADPPTATEQSTPCQECTVLGALGLFLIAAPKSAAMLAQLATFLAPSPVLAPIPRSAPRRIHTARGPPRC